jgi:hypothetical protein
VVSSGLNGLKLGGLTVRHPPVVRQDNTSNIRRIGMKSVNPGLGTAMLE